MGHLKLRHQNESIEQLELHLREPMNLVHKKQCK